MSDPDLAHRWTGLRQDSGDPFAFGPRVKKMYQSLGIPNDSKSLIFSDALTVNKCIDIKKQCDELNFNKGTWTKHTFPNRSTYHSWQCPLASVHFLPTIFELLPQARRARHSILSLSFLRSMISHVSNSATIYPRQGEFRHAESRYY
jgi:hypothetical protein